MIYWNCLNNFQERKRLGVRVPAGVLLLSALETVVAEIFILKM